MDSTLITVVYDPETEEPVDIEICATPPDRSVGINGWAFDLNSVGGEPREDRWPAWVHDLDLAAIYESEAEADDLDRARDRLEDATMYALNWHWKRTGAK